MAYLWGDLGRYQRQLGRIPLGKVSPCIAAYMLWLFPIPTASKPEGQFTHLRASSNQRSTITRGYMQCT